MFHRAHRILMLTMLLATATPAARAQLPADVWWRDGFHPAGLQGSVWALRPFSGGVVVGGTLAAVEDRPALNVVRFELQDGLLARGTAVGEGLNGTVMAFAEHEGELIAGGQFTRSGGTVVERVARWDGKSWQPVGAGLPGVTVKALASYGGHLQAGAYRWDGVAWTNVLQTNGDVRFLAEHGGLLYVAGSFTQARGVAVNHAFAWDGVAVLPLGAGLSGPAVGLAVVDGAVAVATTSNSGLGNVALWDGGAWNVILSGSQIESISAWGDRLVVSHWWRAAPYLWFPLIRAWQDGAWTGLGGFTSRVMTELGGDLLLQADPAAVPGIVSPGLIACGGAGFRAAFVPGDGCDDGFHALAPLGDAAIAVGSFRIAGGRCFDRAVLAAEGLWYPWGAGADLGSDGWFTDVAVIGPETYGVYARSEIDIFTSEICRLTWQNSVAAWERLFAWDSLAWEAYLVPIGDELHALHGRTLWRVALPTGMLAPLPGLEPDGYVADACLHGGALVLAGQIAATGSVPCGHVLRRIGAAWEDLGNPDGALAVTKLASLGDDGLAAVYRDGWGPAASVALLDPGGWRQLGDEFGGEVTELVCHRGYLFAAGDFDRVGDVEAHGLAMWTGATWMPVGSGVTGNSSGRVSDLVSAGRNLWLCGSFTKVAGRPSAGLACWSGDPAFLAALSGVPASPGGGNALLRPAWPNPFNPRTELAFTLPTSGPVRLRVHDARGAVVRTLVDGALAAGEHRPTWDGHDDAGRAAPSGAYFARLEAGAVVETAKLVLVR